MCRQRCWSAQIRGSPGGPQDFIAYAELLAGGAWPQRVADVPIAAGPDPPPGAGFSLSAGGGPVALGKTRH